MKCQIETIDISDHPHGVSSVWNAKRNRANIWLKIDEENIIEEDYTVLSRKYCRDRESNRRREHSTTREYIRKWECSRKGW